MTSKRRVEHDGSSLFRSPQLQAYVRSEDGYVLGLVMLVLMVIGMMSTTLLAGIMVNQQHVRRDRAYTLSLGVAEAGLNQYLWMVASGTTNEALGYAIAGVDTDSDPLYEVFDLTDPYDSSVQGQYAIQVAPPSASNSDVTVTVTGQSSQTVDVPRTVQARIGRPSFSEYVLLVDESVYIGGPLDRVWHGKTHSNTGIRIETADIVDSVSSARSTYDYSGTTKAGVWSQNVPAGDVSRAFWHFPVPPIDFSTVTSDFTRLNGLATNSGTRPHVNLPYVNPVVSGQPHGWYIKLLSGSRYQVAQVTNEVESRTYSSGTKQGGYLTYAYNGGAANSLSPIYSYPPNGVIYANDNVWVEGTGVQGRITIASSGQLNPTGKTALTSIYIIGDLTYAAKDGSVAVGLIAQNNIEIPMYAPYMKSGTLSTMDMEMDAAVIAQQGKEYVHYDATGSSSSWGPRRDLLTIFGAVSTLLTPYRMTYASSGSDFAGFLNGANSYDTYLLRNPPPFFPTVGSFQILDWQELPLSASVLP
jgi:type II secretory pathway pseudopilin PulG